MLMFAKTDTHVRGPVSGMSRWRGIRCTTGSHGAPRAGMGPMTG